MTINHKTTENAAKRYKRANLISTIVVTLFVILALVWIYTPIVRDATAAPPTETPIPPTWTPKPTIEPSITPTITLTPQPTPTPMAPSAYQIEDPILVDPAIPGVLGPAVVLNDDTSIQVDPEFNHPQWYHSDTIAQQIGKEIYEPYYTTIGPGSATWFMDVPLAPGNYNIFVMDTLWSSSGSLDFKVTLGGMELQPFVGQQHVNYISGSTNPSQSFYKWQSIGIYSLDFIEYLSVSTTWDAREMATIIGLDRILIVKYPDSTQDLRALLPAEGTAFVADDLAADFDTKDTWFSNDDVLSWGDQFEMIVNPANDANISWKMNEPAPVGQYGILVWMPQLEGGSQQEVLYQVIVNDIVIAEIPLIQSEFQGGQWVPLGTWEISATEANGYVLNLVNLSVEMQVSANSTGSISADAVAFIKFQ
ncbi:MAG: hypothetical protein JEZ06_09890 [Anaerolineaceae bacterium]|nr:hypothetical protein [Anaerolineaceae bacterium]